MLQEDIDAPQVPPPEARAAGLRKIRGDSRSFIDRPASPAVMDLHKENKRQWL
jgi:hypothetical protein